MAVIYLCPADKRLLCSWEGNANDIEQHFEKEHSGLLFRTNTVNIDLNILRENRVVFLDQETYLLQSYTENHKLFLKLRYLGAASKASNKLYDITITVNNTLYQFEEGRKVQVVTPKTDGWEVNLQYLTIHGQIQSLTCTLHVQDVSRKEPDLKINNRMVEKHACDAIEDSYLDAISLLESKLAELKKDKNNTDDFMDKISHLNLSILEEPFPRSRQFSVDETPGDFLPEISEEMYMACSSCSIDMLPPIYLCVNGHNICSSCRRYKCKECNGVVTPCRNTDLENSSRIHKHPCRYKADGCPEKLFYNEVRGHEARCQYCKYKCQSESCLFEGRFKQLTNHLNVLHASYKISSSLSNEFPKNTEFYISHRSKGVFYCKSTQNGDLITWKAIFCGPKERMFFCELYFKGSKSTEPHFLKRHDNVYEITKSITDLKKIKAKEKNAVLTITSYDS